MNEVQLNDKRFELYLPENKIQKAINEVAERINNDLNEKNPLFLVVLNGAFMFASELIGKFNSSCQVSFVRLKSYNGTQREEKIVEVQGLLEDMENRPIIIVEDIIDTGHTMAHLLKIIQAKKPASIHIATMLFKPRALQVDIQPDYAAIQIANDFVVGYGLDYDGYGRNLRNLYKIKS